MALYDIVNTPGVAADLSHIATAASVTGYLPKDEGLKKALTGADIVVIPAGIPRKPGVSFWFLFFLNEMGSHVCTSIFCVDDSVSLVEEYVA